MNLIIKVSRELLSISKLEKKVKTDLNKTNVIDTKELIFSEKYIQENLELVSSFLNVIVIKNKVKNARINDEEIISTVIDLINNIPTITNLYIKPDVTITYDVFMKLLDNNTLEYLSCYSIPKYLMTRLDSNKHLQIDVRSELFFVSDFMAKNNFDKYSDIYYKKSITIYDNFKSDDLNDFKTFLSINAYLKVIYIKKYSNDLINTIIELLVEARRENIKIVFYEKDNDLEVIVNSITYLKKVYEEHFKEYDITFDIIYSKEYKKKNILKQLNLNAVKITSFVAILVLLFFIVAEKIQTDKDTEKINDINSQITDILSEIDINDIDSQDRDIEYIEADDETVTTTKRPSSGGYVSSYYTNYEQVFEKLLVINSDTVGWVTVNNTKINYPVVKGEDNDYYLKRDFNKNKNSMGWVYMDYRNSVNMLSQNTIIYGHNIKAGLMFGSLRYTLNESWYKKTTNQIITFNTINENMKWQIFSIYKVGVTNDYLYANFNTDEEFLSFVDMIKSRSIYDFGVTIDKDDNILTLSTCYGNGDQRMVVHAKLIKAE